MIIHEMKYEKERNRVIIKWKGVHEGVLKAHRND